MTITYELTEHQKQERERVELKPYVEYLIEQGYRKYKIARALGISKGKLKTILLTEAVGVMMMNKKYRKLACELYWMTFRYQQGGFPWGEAYRRSMRSLDLDPDFASHLYLAFEKEINQKFPIPSFYASRRLSDTPSS